MKFDEQTFKIYNIKNIVIKSSVIAVIGILLSIVGFITDPRFIHSYLVSYVFFTTLSLGGLFFVLAHHMFGADWSVVLRRIPETLMLLVPIMLIFYIPIGMNLDSLYQWTDSVPDYYYEDGQLHWKDKAKMKNSLDSNYGEKENYEKSYQTGKNKYDENFWKHHPTMVAKAAYLNKDFFYIRLGLYFLIWTSLIFSLYKTSVSHKTSLDKQKMKKMSALGLALFAITISFFGFDLIMSLDAAWFSTMFGVYIFAGSYLTAVSFVTLVCLFLHSKGILVDEINEKHYANLGKVLFTFTVFWAYIGGFQYYIYWYANLPEEIFWFIQRWEGPWKYLSLFLIIGHFIIPFTLLIFNKLKRNKTVLLVLSSLFIVLHYIDMYWMVMPNFFRDSHGYIKSDKVYDLSILSWTDLSIFLAMGGILMAIFWILFQRNPIVPNKDSAYNQSATKEES